MKYNNISPNPGGHITPFITDITNTRKHSTFTEEDTFKRLARPKFEEMKELHDEWWLNKNTAKNSMLRISFFKKHGWTWAEFVRENANRRT